MRALALDLAATVGLALPLGFAVVGCHGTHAAAPDAAPPSPAAAPLAIDAQLGDPYKDWPFARDAGALGPPTLEEVRKALDPTFAQIQACVKAAGPMPDAGAAAALRLRFGIAPAGQVFGAELIGRDAAAPCVIAAVKKLEFRAWTGKPMFADVPLRPDGQMVPVAPAPKAPAPDGGR